MKVLVIILGIITIAKGYLLAFTDYYQPGPGSWRFRELYSGTGIRALVHLNITNILMATSFICVPIILYKIFSKYTWELKHKLFGLVFIYSLSIFTILRTDVPNNYTTSRYFLPVLIPVIIVLAGILIERKRTLIAAFSICVITAAPFNYTLLTTHEYHGYYQVLEETSRFIEPGSMVFIDNEDLNLLSRSLVTNLRSYMRILFFQEVRWAH